jgi:hypothetical protein
MPKIAEYEPSQVRPQVVAQPKATDAPRGAFDPAIGKGLLDIAQAGIDIKKRIDTTSAEESLVRFERDKNDVLYNPDTGYFNTAGRNAYDNSSIATKSIEDLKKSYGEKLGQQSKVLFDSAADKHITRSQLDIARHASKGLKTWEITTLESQVENSIENAALYFDDENRLKVQNVIGRQAIFDSSKMMGLGFEATAEKVQTFESSFARSTVTAATASSSEDGKIALEKYGSRLEGPDKIKMEGLIEKKEKTEKTQNDARAAVLTANRLVDQHDDRKDAIEEVNKIEDVDLRKKTMAETMSQFSRKKQAESEFRASSFEDAEDTIMKGGSAEQYKAGDPEGWESLSEKQKRSIDSGVVAVTDWNNFSDLMLLPKKELAKVDPTDHFDKLAKSERSRLISAVKSAGGTGSSKDKVDSQVGRTRTGQTTAAVTDLFGKKSKWNKEKREKVNGFYSLLDDEVAFRESEKDAKLTSEEFTNLLAGLTRTVVQEGSVFRLGIDVELDLTDVPADDVPVLSKFLRDNNVPVTADNLIKAYQQASK